jgi:methylenetetrahydrofolate reductase (NADPH)
MLRIFQDELFDSKKFIKTIELVPGRQSTGRSVDTILQIAKDAFSDKRISAVSITDNPGGNPAVAPDAIGYKIFATGMDVIIHFTCRDMNRIGMESRALQLSMMGMKNILALNGDYVGKGFQGQGAPVFDLDSVSLQKMLTSLSVVIKKLGDPDGFVTGCAVSPFKYTEGEAFTQYAKLNRKVSAGAQFAITQLGYDARKFQELLLIQEDMGIKIPTIGSVYLLTPKVARIMNKGRVPGAVVPDMLLEKITDEWSKGKKEGLKASIERTARLSAVLKGLGYRGIHIGGIHRNFKTAAKILDRLEEIEDRWQEFLPDFNFSHENAFYAFDKKPMSNKRKWRFEKKSSDLPISEKIHFALLQKIHKLLFDLNSPLACICKKIADKLDHKTSSNLLMSFAEEPGKRMLLGCHSCGDCAIMHTGFLCPESGCPKHTRNGACGGSENGICEVNKDKYCIWFRAYSRLAHADETDKLIDGWIPPRIWELDRTSSWLNFHLLRDHQSKKELH